MMKKRSNEMENICETDKKPKGESAKDEDFSLRAVGDRHGRTKIIGDLLNRCHLGKALKSMIQEEL